MVHAVLTPEQASALDAPHLVHAADAAGAYLGLVDRDAAPQRVPGPPPTSDHRWTGAEWHREQTLDEAVADALASIDQAAGAARRRYITDVTAQTVIYMDKLRQAEAFAAAGYVGEAPPYVAAQAAAMGGVSVQAACDDILTTAAVWNDQLSPAIEQARLAAKRLARAAQTHEQLAAIVSAALAELAAI